MQSCTVQAFHFQCIHKHVFEVSYKHHVYLHMVLYKVHLPLSTLMLHGSQPAQHSRSGVMLADIATTRSLYDIAHDMAYRLVSKRAGNMTPPSIAATQPATKQADSSVSAAPASPMSAQVNAHQFSTCCLTEGAHQAVNDLQDTAP